MVGKVEDPPTELSTESETMYLKFKNKTLAKALTEEKIMGKQYLDERNHLQKKVHFLTLLNMKYEDNFKQMSIQCKKMLPNIVAISDSIAEILKLSNDGLNVRNSVSENLVDDSRKLSVCPVSHLESETINRTHAVKPMVSGHVILRPTISLRRLTDPEPNELPHNIIDVTSDDSNDIPESNETENSDSSSNQFRYRAQPVPGLTINYTEENLDEINVVDLEQITENMESMSVPTTDNQLLSCHSLSPILEEDEPDNVRNSVQNLTPHSINHSMASSKTPPVSSNSLKKIHDYDPLEGPSTLLNNRHFNRSCNNISKRRFVPVDYSDSFEESDNDEDWNMPASKKARSKKGRKGKHIHFEDSNTTNREEQKAANKRQRKSPAMTSSPESVQDLKNINLTGIKSAAQNGLLKEARVTISPIPDVFSSLERSFNLLTNNAESTPNNLSHTDFNTSKNMSPENIISSIYMMSEKEPIVVLTQIDDEDMKKVMDLKEKLETSDIHNNSKDSNINDLSFIDERPRRHRLVRNSFKEVSLKCKLRRHR